MMHTAQTLMEKDATKSWSKVDSMKREQTQCYTYMTCSKGCKHSATVLIISYQIKLKKKNSKKMTILS